MYRVLIISERFSISMKNINIKALSIGVLIAGITAGLFAFFVKISFFICFVMITVAMVINGIIAEWEDNEPGGFNNPNEKKQL
jgi:hypothetical protein